MSSEPPTPSHTQCAVAETKQMALDAMSGTIYPIQYLPISPWADLANKVSEQAGTVPTRASANKDFLFQGYARVEGTGILLWGKQAEDSLVLCCTVFCTKGRIAHS
jgi:hypothetical protein